MKIALIHLTDLHFTVNTDFRLKVEPLAKAINGKINNITNVYILLSGDIVYSGKKGEYDIAKRFLSVLKTLLTNGKENIKLDFFFVPGNHDCDFSNESSLRKTLIPGLNYEKIGTDKNISIIIIESYNYIITC